MVDGCHREVGYVTVPKYGTCGYYHKPFPLGNKVSYTIVRTLVMFGYPNYATTDVYTQPLTQK